jgi:anti-sigma factor RsiW
MKHFNICEWADYVRGLASDVQRSAMDAHLSSGCSRCARTASTFRSVTAIAGGEAGLEPPDHAVRYAQAAYSLFRPETTSLPRLLARLVHDSLLEPLPAGLRAQARLSRHALYEAGSYYLDLQLELQRPAGPVMLVGQLADRHNPPAHTAVPVWLMQQKSVVASTVCDRFGEFQLEYTPARDLRLCFPLREANKRLEIPLSRLTPKIPAPRRPARRSKGEN